MCVLMKYLLLSCFSTDSFAFSRDFRHKLPNITYISDAHAPHFVNRITAETLHILAEDGLVKKFITPETKQMVDHFFSLFKKCQHKEDYSCIGNHHLHLNQPEVVCDVINKFLKKHHPRQIYLKNEYVLQIPKGKL